MDSKTYSKYSSTHRNDLITVTGAHVIPYFHFCTCYFTTTWHMSVTYTYTLPLCCALTLLWLLLADSTQDPPFQSIQDGSEQEIKTQTVSHCFHFTFLDLISQIDLVLYCRAFNTISPNFVHNTHRIWHMVQMYWNSYFELVEINRDSDLLWCSGCEVIPEMHDLICPCRRVAFASLI